MMEEAGYLEASFESDDVDNDRDDDEEESEEMAASNEKYEICVPRYQNYVNQSVSFPY